jgi:UDP-N-acetylglucosamine 2-epimerase (non-hydrolysing)
MILTLVVGARPNFMKISPLIDSINKYNNSGDKKIQYRLVHTGQHYDKTMSEDFFDQLQIPKPNINLNCTGLTQNELTAKIMIEFEKELILHKPDIVVVVGDVTSTMACSIVAKKLQLRVAHIESGIRSFDREMPEEINRLITDSICDYYFTTSETAGENLLKENIDPSKIFFVGNTMIDCLIKNLPNISQPKEIDEKYIENKQYFLMTLHRPSNVDQIDKLKNILQHIDNVVGNHKVIFPVHHRTKNKLVNLGLKFKNIVLTEPQKYLQFIYLIKHSMGVITDSGGITEETTYLNIPCITLRNTTERPETVSLGTNKLIGDDLLKLSSCIEEIINKRWKNTTVPKYWDGFTSYRIIKNLIENNN